MMGLPISTIKFFILAQFVVYIIASQEPNDQHGQSGDSEKDGRNPNDVNKDGGSESKLSQKIRAALLGNATHQKQGKKMKINRKASFFKLKTNSSFLKQFHNKFAGRHKKLLSKFKAHLSGTKLGKNPNNHEAKVTHPKIPTATTEPSKLDETTKSTQQNTNSDKQGSEENKSRSVAGQENEPSKAEGRASVGKSNKIRTSGADMKTVLDQTQKEYEPIKQENFEKFKEFLTKFNSNKPRAFKVGGSGSRARDTSGEVLDFTPSQLKELYRVWRKKAEGGKGREATDDTDDDAITPSKLKKLYAEWAANALIEEEEKKRNSDNFNDQDSSTDNSNFSDQNSPIETSKFDDQNSPTENSNFNDKNSPIETSEEVRRSGNPSKPKHEKTSQERAESLVTTDVVEVTKLSNKGSERSSKEKPESEEGVPTMDVDKLTKYYKKWGEKSSTEKPEPEEGVPTLDVDKLTKYYKKWEDKSSDENKRDEKESIPEGEKSEDEGQGSIDGGVLTKLYDKWAQKSSSELSEGEGSLDSQKLSKVYDKWAISSSAERREEEALKKEQDKAPQEVRHKGTINSKKLAKHYDDWRYNFVHSSTQNPVEDATSTRKTSEPEESTTVAREIIESTTVEVAQAREIENGEREASRERKEKAAREASRERKETRDKEASRERREKIDRDASRERERQRQNDKEASRERERQRQNDKEASREREERRNHRAREDSIERKAARRASKKRKEHEVRESSEEASKEIKDSRSDEASNERRESAEIGSSPERVKTRRWRQRALNASQFSASQESKESHESESRESNESSSREGRRSAEESSSVEDSESEERKDNRSNEDKSSDEAKEDCLELDDIKPQPNAGQLEAAVESRAKQLASYDIPKNKVNINLQAEIPSSSIRRSKTSEGSKANSQAEHAFGEGIREESIAEQEQFIRADVTEPHVQVNIANVEPISEPPLRLPAIVLAGKIIDKDVEKEEINQADLVPKISPQITVSVLNPGNSMEKLTIAETKVLENKMRKHEQASHVGPQDIRTAKLYVYSTKKYDSKISDATNALGSVKVRWWEQLWPWTNEDNTKKLESEIESSLPNLSFKDIIPKFKMYKNQLKILISRMVPRCPEVHSMKLLKTWVSMFRSAWPNLLRMTNLSVKYAEALKNQLTMCLDTIVRRKFGSSKVHHPDPVSAESEESVKVKREPANKDLYIQEFNEELANPLVSYFAKLPQMVQGETLILRRSEKK